jgi:ribosomal protein S27AE
MLFVRQCLNCGVLDAREVWDDEDEAAPSSRWECLECGSTRFEVVVMPDPEPATEADVEE